MYSSIEPSPIFLKTKVKILTPEEIFVLLDKYSINSGLRYVGTVVDGVLGEEEESIHLFVDAKNKNEYILIDDGMSELHLVPFDKNLLYIGSTSYLVNNLKNAKDILIKENNAKNIATLKNMGEKLRYSYFVIKEK